MSDEALRQAQQVAARHGYSLVRTPDLQHHGNEMIEYHQTIEELSELSRRYRAFNLKLVSQAFNLKDGDTVKPLAPYGHKMFRCVLNGYSVFIEAFNIFGDPPQYEVYIGGVTYRYRIDKTEELLHHTRRARASQNQKT